MACTFMTYIVMAYVGMAFIAVVCIVVASIGMAFIAVACIVMAYTVMAFIRQFLKFKVLIAAVSDNVGILVVGSACRIYV